MAVCKNPYSVGSLEYLVVMLFQGFRHRFGILRNLRLLYVHSSQPISRGGSKLDLLEQVVKEQYKVGYDRYVAFPMRCQELEKSLGKLIIPNSWAAYDLPFCHQENKNFLSDRSCPNAWSRSFPYRPHLDEFPENVPCLRTVSKDFSIPLHHLVEEVVRNWMDVYFLFHIKKMNMR